MTIKGGIASLLAIALAITAAYYAGHHNGVADQQLIDSTQATKNTAIAAQKQADIQAGAINIASAFYQTMASAQTELETKNEKIKQLEKARAAATATRNVAHPDCMATAGPDSQSDYFTYQLWNIAAATDTLPEDPHRQTIDATRTGAQVIQDSAADNIRLRIKVNALQATLLKIQPDQ
jgi:hypothetical protein